MELLKRTLVALTILSSAAVFAKKDEKAKTTETKSTEMKKADHDHATPQDHDHTTPQDHDHPAEDAKKEEGKPQE